MKLRDLFLASYLLISLGCIRPNTNDGVDDLISGDVGDSSRVNIKLSLEVSDIGANSNYAVGMSLKYEISNNTKHDIFIVFRPYYLTIEKHGDKGYVEKSNYRISEQILGQKLWSQSTYIPCLSLKMSEIQSQFYDSIRSVDEPKRINKDVTDIVFSKSLLFLKRGQRIECSHTLTPFMKRNENGFERNGNFTFAYIYDGKVDSLHGYQLPKSFRGFTRYRNVVKSNVIELGIH